MRWPFMLRRTHETFVDDLKQHHESLVQRLHVHFMDRMQTLRDDFQDKVDTEYTRARDEGRRQVHAWAVEVNYNLFCGTSPFGNMQGTQRQRSAAALQDAEHQFAPTRTQLEAPKEITDGTVRS